LDLRIPTDTCIPMNFVNPPLTDPFGVCEAAGLGLAPNPHSTRNFWLFGLINAIPYLSAAVVYVHSTLSPVSFCEAYHPG
jgi:hypothetical protein